MTIPDILFIKSLHNYTRVFDDANSLRLEWSREGLNICRNTDNAVITCPDRSRIPLPEGNVIQWNKFDRNRSYFIFHNDIKYPEFRIIDHNSKQWLDCTNGESNADIMKQTALALEDSYADSYLLQELKECIETAKTVLPINIDDDLRQSVINRWYTRLIKIAAESFINPNSTDGQLNMAYEILSK